MPKEIKPTPSLIDLIEEQNKCIDDTITLLQTLKADMENTLQEIENNFLNK